LQRTYSWCCIRGNIRGITKGITKTITKDITKPTTLDSAQPFRARRKRRLKPLTTLDSRLKCAGMRDIFGGKIFANS